MKIPEPDMVNPFFTFAEAHVDLIPKTPGCYSWSGCDGEIRYVGGSGYLPARILSYKPGFLIFGIQVVNLKCWISSDYKTLERRLIRHCRPTVNVAHIKYDFDPNKPKPWELPYSGRWA